MRLSGARIAPKYRKRLRRRSDGEVFPTRSRLHHTLASPFRTTRRRTKTPRDPYDAVVPRNSPFWLACNVLEIDRRRSKYVASRGAFSSSSAVTSPCPDTFSRISPVISLSYASASCRLSHPPPSSSPPPPPATTTAFVLYLFFFFFFFFHLQVSSPFSTSTDSRYLLRFRVLFSFPPASSFIPSSSGVLRRSPIASDKFTDSTTGGTLHDRLRFSTAKDGPPFTLLRFFSLPLLSLFLPTVPQDHRTPKRGTIACSAPTNFRDELSGSVSCIGLCRSGTFQFLNLHLVR